MSLKTLFALKLVQAEQSAHSMAAAPRKTAPSIPHPTLAAAALPVGVLVAAAPLPVALSLGVGDPP